MRSILFGLTALAVVAVGSQAVAQAPSLPPELKIAFGPGLSSEELTKLPQTPGAKGDQQRHYFFAAAGKEMPYRLYVPKSYDPKVGAPLIVALHGYGGNHNYFFAIAKDIPALCEQYGFIFVAPMGYSPGSWYGAPLSIPGNIPRNPPPAGQAARTAPPPPPAEPEKSPAQERFERALSEQDVMTVLGLVRHEYKIDPARIYLMGHSMGGFGTWFLGAKFSNIWAAIAPMSGTFGNYEFDLPALKNVPVMLSVGSTETATVSASKAVIDVMDQRGMTTAYYEVEGGTHGSMIAPSVPQIFAFFAKQKKDLGAEAAH
jgi:poly(3-hydroxybutyrate) depolymerase